MYKNEFDNNLKQNKLFNAYFFYGVSDFLIDMYAKKVCKLHGSEEDIEKLYYDEYNYKYAKDKLLQSSLFSSNNLLLIKRDKKIPKTELQTLVDACNSNPDSVLVFCYMADDGKTMESPFSAKNNAASVRFFAPRNDEALKVLEEQALNLGVHINASGLSHLYFMHRQDLALAVNDLKKLQILKDEVSVKEIDIHCFGIGSVNIDEFMHKLFSAEEVSDDLHSLIEEGLNEIYLLTQLTSFLQQLFMIASYIRINGVADAKEILGYKPPNDIWNKKVRLATWLSSKQGKFTLIFDILLSLELEMKSTKVSDMSALLEANLRKISANLR